MDIEVAIVGGGPAGLSAALMLGRARRRVVVFDGGRHRNDEARAVHGFLTRDGTAPGSLRALGRAELRAYRTVSIVDQPIVAAARGERGFVLHTAGGEQVHARRLVLATGVHDVWPPVPGVEAFHGRRVMPCPYCDGWELRDRPLGAYAHADERGARYAALLQQWSRDVVLYTGGPAQLSDDARARLRRRGIELEERAVERIDDDPEHDGIRLALAGGRTRRCAALFYHLGCQPGNRLARLLGAELDDEGGVAVDRRGATSIAGLYAAGDATRDTLQAIVGAGEGAAVALAVDQSLAMEDWDAS
jgi:thioredoxin reductase